MKKNLSIIVPIYGVEQYLRKCVDSLLNQNILCENIQHHIQPIVHQVP